MACVQVRRVLLGPVMRPCLVAFEMFLARLVGESVHPLEECDRRGEVKARRLTNPFEGAPDGRLDVLVHRRISLNVHLS